VSLEHFTSFFTEHDLGANLAQHFKLSRKPCCRDADNTSLLQTSASYVLSDSVATDPGPFVLFEGVNELGDDRVSYFQRPASVEI
jgi:hypothetical protein